MTLDMTQGKILPVLIKFTIPILIGDIFQQLYNIVDTIIVGRTLGAKALAAVGSTGTLMFLIVGVAGTLAHGFSVVTSQRFGAHDAAGVRKSFGNGMMLLVLVSLLCTTVGMACLRSVLRTMNTPEDIFEDAYHYIAVIVLGILLTSFYNYFASNLRAIGNSRIPLYFLIFSSVLNIVLDLVFIEGLHWGVAGAAAATVVSQAVSAVLCLAYIIRQEAGLMPRREEWKPDEDIIRQQLYIGIPMAVQSAITASGTVVMQAAANIFGSIAVAANTAAGKCRMLFTQPMMSAGLAAATFAGQNYGSNNIERVRKGTYQVVRIITIYAIVSMILSIALLPLELRVFISNPAEIAEMLPWARTCMILTSVFYAPLGYIFIFRNVLQGCGKSVFAMSAGFVELICRLACAVLAIRLHSYELSCLCDSSAWGITGIYLWISFHIITKRMLEKAS